jgi:hypothetical protein
MKHPLIAERVDNLINKLYPSKNLSNTQYNSLRKFFINTKAIKENLLRNVKSSPTIQEKRNVRSQKKSIDKIQSIPDTLFLENEELKRYNRAKKNKNLDITFPISSLFDDARVNESNDKYIIPKNFFRESQKEFVDIQTYLASNGVNITYENIFDSDIIFKNKILKSMTKILQEQLQKLGSFKISTSAYAEFINADNNMQLGNIHLSTTMIRTSSDIINFLAPNIHEIFEDILEIDLVNSGYIYSRMKSIKFGITKCKNKRGGIFIDTPEWIKDRKAVINIQNDNENCFLYCIAAADHPVNRKDHPNRSKQYEKYFKDYNIIDIKFPLELKDIEKFERNNKKAINVICYKTAEHEIDPDSFEFYTEYLSIYHNSSIPEEQEIYKYKIELLLLRERSLTNNSDKVTSKFHYVLINNFNRLVKPSLIDYSDKVKHTDPNYFCEICRKCFNIYTCQVKYNKHLEYCTHAKCSVKMPSDEYKSISSKKYKMLKNSQRHGLVGYYDTEAILEPINENIGKATLRKQKHIASSYAYKFISDIELSNTYKLYRGDDPLKDFMLSLENVISEYYSKVNKYPKCPKLSKKELNEYYRAEKCFICEESIPNTYMTKAGVEIKNCRVKHHNHATGKYLGPAHLMCNLAWSIPAFVPIFAHNASKYDNHFIVNYLHLLGDGEIRVIPKNDEEYVSISKMTNINFKSGEEDKKVEVRFLDSCRFMMATSLDELGTNLLRENKACFKNLLHDTSEAEQSVIFWEEIKTLEEKSTTVDRNFNVTHSLKREISRIPRIKGIFPYDYIDSRSKYEECDPPSKDKFYNKLKLAPISEQEYNQFKRVWCSIESPTIGKYSDLYLKLDVLILADVFEKFRDTCLSNYKIDPVYYYTLPSLSWDAALKISNITLERIQDYDMYLLFENGIRGGISQICGDRYVDASNNNYVTNPSIDKDTPNQDWLLYIDANNLYGHSMSQKLPTHNFKWLTTEEIEDLNSKIENKQVTGDEDVGYVLDVDIKYPSHLHKKFVNLPIVPEKKTIPNNKLSKYTYDRFDKKPDGSIERVISEKLILDFEDKKNYTIHIKNLIYYKSMGIEITVNRGVSFVQSNWLKSYIDFNTTKRTEARNDFDKNLFKLLNNAVYGKTMENVRLRVNVEVCDRYERLAKIVREPNFAYIKRFSENLVAVHSYKVSVYLDKPIYVGFSVLELSKLHMFKFYYDTLKSNFENVNLLYMDTDSFTLHFRTANLYSKLYDLKDAFDFNEYPKDHVLHDVTNKKVIGKFKDELSGNLMNKFISLRSKMYAFTKLNEAVEKKVLKGINRSVVEKKITFDDYFNCLMNNKMDKHQCLRFQSNLHQVYTIELTKVALTSTDDKRHYLDNIRSIPYGSKS